MTRGKFLNILGKSNAERWQAWSDRKMPRTNRTLPSIGSRSYRQWRKQMVFCWRYLNALDPRPTSPIKSLWRRDRAISWKYGLPKWHWTWHTVRNVKSKNNYYNHNINKLFSIIQYYSMYKCQFLCCTYIMHTNTDHQEL